MIPAAFDYEVAESADHAVSLLGEHGEDAKLLAGGHSLLPLMRLRLAAPSVLVDIGRIGDLNYVRDGGDHVAVGALTTMEEAHFSDLLQRDCPILAHTAGEVGDPQVRHRGTVGGTVAHADPASDIPTVLLALDATLIVKGPGGERTIQLGLTRFWVQEGTTYTGTVSATAAKDVLAEMFTSEAPPATIVERKGLAQISDTGELEAVVAGVVAANPDLAEKFRGGKRGVLGALVGQVMRETRGRANPKLVSDLLERAIGG